MWEHGTWVHRAPSQPPSRGPSRPKSRPEVCILRWMRCARLHIIDHYWSPTATHLYLSSYICTCFGPEHFTNLQSDIPQHHPSQQDRSLRSTTLDVVVCPILDIPNPRLTVLENPYGTMLQYAVLLIPLPFLCSFICSTGAGRHRANDPGQQRALGPSELAP